MAKPPQRRGAVKTVAEPKNDRIGLTAMSDFAGPTDLTFNRGPIAELAREHVAALDSLPRATLVTCRAGTRSSAVVYLDDLSAK
jgi:protein tyrosine phosphatase (PTP) superfamily phosphohydrolase (DUF442 family)